MASEIVGGDRLARTLAAAADDIGDLDAPNAQIAENVRARAARAAPRRSGRLAASGTVTRSRGTVAVVSFGSSAIRYAGPINFGVSARAGMRGPHNIRPTRFFTAAAERENADAADEYTQPIQRIMNTVRGQ